MLTLLGSGSPIAYHRLRVPCATRTHRAPLRLRASTPLSLSKKLWSPSDLTLFAESPWASWLERLAREQPTHPLASAMDAPDAFLQMLGRKGAESEAAVLRSLRESCRDDWIDLSAVRGSAEERVAATQDALAKRPAVIYQAPLLGGGFFGIADFLVRVDDDADRAPIAEAPGAAAGTATQYMVWDAKLGRHPRPSQVLQLCCYAEMLAAQQGAPVERVGLVLGASPLVLRVASYDALYRRVRERFLAAQDAFDPLDPPPPPDPRIATGRWSSLAASELERRDDLRRVARLSRLHAVRLRAAGVHTATQLASLDDAARAESAASGGAGVHAGRDALAEVAGVPPPVLRRLARQAALQRRASQQPEQPPPFDVLRGACTPGSGLALLPRPHAADAFFDLEGFPFATLPATAAGGLPDLLALSSAAAEDAALSSAASEDAAAATAASASASAALPGMLPEGSPREVASAAVETRAAAMWSESGREYLWGLSTRPTEHPTASDDQSKTSKSAAVAVAAASSAPRGGGEYLAWWAHDAAAERTAFCAAVDWIEARRRTHPGMHVYHYGAYEVSALRRLAGRHGTREKVVDGLLRSGVLIDLYEVVRHGLLLGEPSYSIKNVERLYRPKRDTEVGKGDQSVAAYNSWLDAPDGPDASTSETLRALAEYNRDDCESTRALADWLWRLRCERCGQPPGAPTASEAADTPAEASPEAAEGEAAGVGDAGLPQVVDEEEAEVARLEALLCDRGVSWPETSVLCDTEVRETLDDSS